MPCANHHTPPPPPPHTHTSTRLMMTTRSTKTSQPFQTVAPNEIVKYIEQDEAMVEEMVWVVFAVARR